MSFLKNHPFAVEAYFNSSLVLTFAVPKQQLQPLLPPHLELDTFDDTWAFIAVAMVQTTGLRPKGFPKFIGNDFFLIGYRIFVRYTNKAGKRLRGLYIIKSETDKKMMTLMGNIFTHYNYTTTDIKQSVNQNTRTVQSLHSDFSVTVEATGAATELPATSPFKDWKEARRFAGPLPFTFTYNNKKSEMLIIEGVRQNWEPAPVTVHNYRFGFLEKLNIAGAVLANAFVLQNIPYYWRKGKIEIWK